MVRQMSAERPRERDAVLAIVCERILAVRRPHPVRVAVDGVDGAGKTTLADELAPLIERRGRPVVRASVDGFHRPRAERLRRGAESADGYFEDSFDYAALRAALLEPLGPGGDRRYRTAVFDFRSDVPREGGTGLAPADAILLFDGVFLLRPKLNDLWDFRIFVEADFEETLRRALARDVELFGSVEATRRRYERRYIPGQRIYLGAVAPRELADLVLLNDDARRPVIVSSSSATPG
jgi:uridine kinase